MVPENIVYLFYFQHIKKQRLQILKRSLHQLYSPIYKYIYNV